MLTVLCRGIGRFAARPILDRELAVVGRSISVGAPAVTKYCRVGSSPVAFGRAPGAPNQLVTWTNRANPETLKSPLLKSNEVLPPGGLLSKVMPISKMREWPAFTSTSDVPTAVPRTRVWETMAPTLCGQLSS